MDIYCVICGDEDVVPSTLKYEPMCRKCVKNERAERKKGRGADCNKKTSGANNERIRRNDEGK